MGACQDCFAVAHDWNTCTSSDNGSQQVGICGGLAPLTVHGGDGMQSTFTPSNVSDESVLL